MSHELEIKENGEASMAWAGETPWHGLGKKVPADLTPKQMLKAAGLDWNVYKEDAFYYLPDEKNPGQYTAHEMDTVPLLRSTDKRKLAEVTRAWEPTQNEEAFAFFNEFVAAGSMEMHTAGSLHNGEIVWALARVKDEFELFGGDKVESYLLFTNPHRFGQSIDVRFTPIRVVCNNTLTLSLSQNAKNVVRITHRKKFDQEKIKHMLGIAHTKLDHYKAMAEFLGSKYFDDESLNQYFSYVFPVFTEKTEGAKEKSKSHRAAIEWLGKQPGHEFAEGTWWHAFNTVTFMVDHMIGRTNDTRLYSAWYGANATLKTKALELATEFAEASA